MKRGKFSLSNYKLFSCDMGELVPIGLTEVLPGDTIQQATSALVRASPLLSPVMHPVNVRIHHWYVPNRIIWDGWENFITGGPKNDDPVVFPTISLAAGAATAVGSLADYLGIPTGGAITTSALPFRAYAAIFNEWYRDQDLVPAVGLALTSGPDTVTSTALLNCAWEKDYFTSARPWEQKGDAVSVGLSGNVAVQFARGGTPTALTSGSTSGFPAGAVRTDVQGPNDAPVTASANLAAATAININDLREAFALQRYNEARARYGSRYTEYLRYLGVNSSDARLQRPEYLGGGKNTIQFSEVLQTAEGKNPVGQLAGHGIAAMRSNRYRRYFEEHGYVVTVMSVRPKTMYSQGIKRLWNKRTKEDFWQRELEHIGQQPILNKEIYAAGPTPEGVFGYQDRYDEYRRAESSIAGEFRTTELNYWHMARDFAAAPALNASFINCVPTERTFAVPSRDVLYVMANHSIQARRLVSQSGESFIF